MVVEAARADFPLCQLVSTPESSYERANGACRPIKVRDTYSPSCDAAVGLVGLPHIYGWANIYGLQRIVMCLRYTLNSADPREPRLWVAVGRPTLLPVPDVRPETIGAELV
jgi:hypothetical protein